MLFKEQGVRALRYMRDTQERQARKLRADGQEVLASRSVYAAEWFSSRADKMTYGAFSGEVAFHLWLERRIDDADKELIRKDNDDLWFVRGLLARVLAWAYIFIPAGEWNENN